MNKEFVTYEQALALKELGFNESCFGCYQLSELRDYKKGLEVSWIMTLNTLNGYRIYDDETQTSASLKQQVFRWLSIQLDMPNLLVPVNDSSQNTLIDKLILELKSKHLLL